MNWAREIKIGVVQHRKRYYSQKNEFFTLLYVLLLVIQVNKASSFSKKKLNF